MTDRIEDITRAVVYEVYLAMGDDGLNALLTADDLLASMAVPVTQFDFTYADKGRLNKLMLAVHDFIRKSKLSVNSYTKEGLKAKFDNLWVPTLSKEQKQEKVVLDDSPESIYRNPFLVEPTSALLNRKMTELISTNA